MGFEDETTIDPKGFKAWTAKNRTAIMIACIIFLVVVSTFTGFAYGKANICKKSGGVMALVPGAGEQCVQRFIDAQDCRNSLRPEELMITAGFCRDATGLYPLIP